MKYSSIVSFALSSLILTACSSTSSFNAKDLKAEIYQGYWAMQPVENQYRVLKFHPNGLVKIYDYSCNFQDGSYSLNETETVYLSPIKENLFTLLDAEKKPFAKYEILQLNAQRFQAKQSFEQAHPLILTYTNLKGAKPLCY
ncbi:hypothetical protein F542_9700 [Bibersteinia trehalosi USDA-ARS-USMARC-188]|uniref:Lipoprotein n=2 Tax=Bibersteinia trehalosi TaxID=47735 RepID=A0A4V7I9I4_BIBTR|nr:hypothetical protein [Bibersteinia trehalosi]AGH38511.1 hypothetical protein WQG_12340 [Bibersteinia trehalosi USDA-ARS-USMARC-192]AHG81688.1 hypothetical protein F542_9700 [Bibersteinia trehalosi USDA-ARS-USMARC-188]AHG83970.1 hypothetical protein F543_11060 [Bibersteinia trehalosi USDA-ARS-USMARC-189]